MADDDGAGVSFNSPSEFDRNMALAGYDRTHNFHVAVVYQLPWQSDDGSHGNVFRAIVNDWQINGTFAAFSGTPFTVTANGAIVNMPGNQQTADLVGDVTKIGEIGASGTYYDPAAWAQPQGVRFGNTGRNQFRGPGAVNLDMSLFRAFPMGGDAPPRVPRRSVEPDEHTEVRQPERRCQQRQLHAHYRHVRHRDVRARTSNGTSASA